MPRNAPTRCTTCGRSPPAVEFYASHSIRKCKECWREYVRARKTPDLATLTASWGMK